MEVVGVGELIELCILKGLVLYSKRVETRSKGTLCSTSWYELNDLYKRINIANVKDIKHQSNNSLENMLLIYGCIIYNLFKTKDRLSFSSYIKCVYDIEFD